MTIGTTTARDFPQVGGGSPDPGAYPTDPDSIFAMKLNPTLSGFVYSRVIGGNTGSGISRALAVAIGPGGVAYLTGETSAPDFPVTPGAIGYAAYPTDPSIIQQWPPPKAISYRQQVGIFSYNLNFKVVGADPTVYTAPFQVR